MRSEYLRHLAILFIAFGLFQGGCSPFGAGTQRQTKYYVLNSMQSGPTPVQPLADLSNIGIGVGPIRMPLYLDRIRLKLPSSPSGPDRCRKTSAGFWQKIYRCCWQPIRSEFFHFSDGGASIIMSPFMLPDSTACRVTRPISEPAAQF